jgi:hypothetical protein
MLLTVTKKTVFTHRIQYFMNSNRYLRSKQDMTAKQLTKINNYQLLQVYAKCLFFLEPLINLGFNLFTGHLGH